MTTQILEREERRPTRTDLPAENRRVCIELPNTRLADALDLMMQAKQAHWNVRGPSFFGPHQLFDEVHGK
jgi:starvation-inducible DNA-binding protein